MHPLGYRINLFSFKPKRSYISLDLAACLKVSGSYDESRRQ